MFIQAIKDKYAKMKDTSGLTNAQLDTRVKWAKRGALIAAVCCVAAAGIAVAGGAAGALAAGTATGKIGLSASFMAASSAVKSFISNRICAGLQRHYRKEQVKRGDGTAAAKTPESTKPAIFIKRGSLGAAFSKGLKSAKNILRPTQLVSGFSAPKA